MKSLPKTRGGKRAGAGRPALGKKTYAVTLTESNVSKARRKKINLSGLLDELLAGWLKP